MKKLIMSAIMCVALIASTSVMAQDAKKAECCKAKTECTKEDKKACTKDKKTCADADKKACTKDKKACASADKKACCKDKAAKK